MKLRLFREHVRVTGHAHLVVPHGWPYDEAILYRCSCGWFRWMPT